jgi:hypothetical protein
MGNLFRICYLLAVFCLIFVTVKIPVVGLSIHDLFLLAAMGIWLVESLLHQGQDGWSFSLHPLWVSGLLVLIGGLVSSLRAVAPISSLVVTIKTFFVLTLWISMTMVVVRRGGFQQTIWAFTAAVVVVSGIAFFDRMTGLDIGGKISGRPIPYFHRSDATLEFPNELAYLTSVGLPIVFGLWLFEIQRRRNKILLFVLPIMIAMVALTVYLTGSIAGMAGALLSMALLLFFVVLKGSPRVRFGLATLAIIMGLGIVVYLSVLEQFSTVETFMRENIVRVLDRTGPDRLDVISEAVDAISANPLIGYGMDQSATGGLPNSERVTRVGIHNVTFASWVSGGILVLVGMLFGYFVAFFTATHAMLRGARQMDWIVVAVGAATFAWLFFDQTQPSLQHRTSWFTLALLFGIGYQIRFLGHNLAARQSSGHWIEDEGLRV